MQSESRPRTAGMPCHANAPTRDAWVVHQMHALHSAQSGAGCGILVPGTILHDVIIEPDGLSGQRVGVACN